MRANVVGDARFGGRIWLGCAGWCCGSAHGDVERQALSKAGQRGDVARLQIQLNEPEDLPAARR